MKGMNNQSVHLFGGGGRADGKPIAAVIFFWFSRSCAQGMVDGEWKDGIHYLE